MAARNKIPVPICFNEYNELIVWKSTENTSQQRAENARRGYSKVNFSESLRRTKRQPDQNR